jgi:hypothetical protein
LTESNSARRIPQVINLIISGPCICIQSELPYMIIQAIMSIDQKYCPLTWMESIRRKIRWKYSKITWQQVSWKISWNAFTRQICLDDPRVNLMVRRSLRIWICNQSLDFFLGQTVDACDLPVAQLV